MYFDSYAFAEAGARPQLLSAAVLTVLASAPPAGSFRPPYTGGDKTIRFNVTDLDYTPLASLSPVASTPQPDDVARYFERPWIDHVPNPRAAAVEYEQSDSGLPEWGIRHAIMPAADNKNWSATYRRCCTAVAWNGYMLAAHIMGAKTLWNHDALFDYQDRYMQVTAKDGDFPGWRSWSNFTEEMWDAYRGSYGGLWAE